MADLDNRSKLSFSLSLEAAPVSFSRPGPTQSLLGKDVAYMMKSYHKPNFMFNLISNRACQEVFYGSFLVLEKQLAVKFSLVSFTRKGLPSFPPIHVKLNPLLSSKP